MEISRRVARDVDPTSTHENLMRAPAASPPSSSWRDAVAEAALEQAGAPFAAHSALRELVEHSVRARLSLQPPNEPATHAAALDDLRDDIRRTVRAHVAALRDALSHSDRTGGAAHRDFAAAALALGVGSAASSTARAAAAAAEAPRSNDDDGDGVLWSASSDRIAFGSERSDEDGGRQTLGDVVELLRASVGLDDDDAHAGASVDLALGDVASRALHDDFTAADALTSFEWHSLRATLRALVSHRVPHEAASPTSVETSARLRARCVALHWRMWCDGAAASMQRLQLFLNIAHGLRAALALTCDEESESGVSAELIRTFAQMLELVPLLWEPNVGTLTSAAVLAMCDLIKRRDVLSLLAEHAPSAEWLGAWLRIDGGRCAAKWRTRVGIRAGECTVPCGMRREQVLRHMEDTGALAAIVGGLRAGDAYCVQLVAALMRRRSGRRALELDCDVAAAAAARTSTIAAAAASLRSLLNRDEDDAVMEMVEPVLSTNGRIECIMPGLCTRGVRAPLTPSDAAEEFITFIVESRSSAATATGPAGRAMVWATLVALAEVDGALSTRCLLRLLRLLDDVETEGESLEFVQKLIATRSGRQLLLRRSAQGEVEGSSRPLDFIYTRATRSLNMLSSRDNDDDDDDDATPAAATHAAIVHLLEPLLCDRDCFAALARCGAIEMLALHPSHNAVRLLLAAAVSSSMGWTRVTQASSARAEECVALLATEFDHAVALCKPMSYRWSLSAQTIGTSSNGLVAVARSELLHCAIRVVRAAVDDGMAWKLLHFAQPGGSATLAPSSLVDRMLAHLYALCALPHAHCTPGLLIPMVTMLLSDGAHSGVAAAAGDIVRHSLPSVLDVAMELVFDPRSGMDEEELGLRLLLSMVASLDGAAVVRRRLDDEGRTLAQRSEEEGGASEGAPPSPIDATSWVRQRVMAAMKPVLPTTPLRRSSGAESSATPPLQRSLAVLFEPCARGTWTQQAKNALLAISDPLSRSRSRRKAQRDGSPVAQIESPLPLSVISQLTMRAVREGGEGGGGGGEDVRADDGDEEEEENVTSSNQSSSDWMGALVAFVMSSPADAMAVVRYTRRVHVRSARWLTASAGLVAGMLTTELPRVAAALRLHGISAAAVAMCWMQQAFLSVLPTHHASLHALVLLRALFGVDIELYVCVALFRHLAPTLLSLEMDDGFGEWESSSVGSSLVANVGVRLAFLQRGVAAGFDCIAALPYIAMLQTRHREMCCGEWRRLSEC